MKKNILLALTAAMLLSATACSGGEKESSGNVSSQNTTSAPSTTSSPADESTPASDDVIKPDESKEFSGLAGFETAPNNTNLTAGGSFCDTEDGFYYADESGIYHVTDDKTEQIYKGKAASLCMRRDMLYFLQEDGNICVYSGGSPSTAVTCESISLAASDTGTYYLDSSNRLYRIFGATMNTGAYGSCLNVAGDYIIYSEAESGSLCAFDPNTDNVILIAEKGTSPVVSGDKVYYVDGDGALASTSLADGKTEVIAEGCDGSIAVGTDELYYVSGAKIMSAADGESVEVYSAAAEDAELSALSICDETLYFAENGVMMQLSDGTPIEFTVTLSE